jgi:hypothetical protein
MTTAAETEFPARLSLSWLGWINHYFMGLTLAVLSASVLIGAASGKHLRDSSPWWIAGICATFAIHAFVTQRRRLAFTAYNTLDDAHENYAKVIALIERKQWDVVANTPGSSISAKVRANWYELTWGDLVTVVFVGSRVAINSIGNPYAGPHGSATWKSRAKSQVQEIANAIRVVI